MIIKSQIVVEYKPSLDNIMKTTKCDFLEYSTKKFSKRKFTKIIYRKTLKKAKLTRNKRIN